MLPDESAELLAYLATTGDIWACWLGDNPRSFKFDPAPVADFHATRRASPIGESTERLFLKLELDKRFTF